MTSEKIVRVWLIIVRTSMPFVSWQNLPVFSSTPDDIFPAEYICPKNIMDKLYFPNSFWTVSPVVT